MGPGKRLIACLTAVFVAMLMTMAACGGSSHNPTNSGNNSGGGAGSSNPGNSGGSGGSGGSGSGGGGSSSGASGHFAYVVNAGGASISAFSQNSSTGALTPLSGSPFKGAVESDGVAILGNVLYAAQAGSGTTGVVSFGINSDGSLSQLATTAMTGAHGSEDVSHGLWTAGTQCLYAASNQDGIWSWKAGNGGTLTSVPNTAQSLGPNLSIAVSPNGKWLFATFEQISGGGTFETDTYSIDTNSCAITHTGLAATLGFGQSNSAGKAPNWVNMTVDPGSKYVFYAQSFGGNVWVESIGSDGSLTPVAGAPFSTGGAPFSLAATANYLYVGDFGAAFIYGFTIGSNGALTPMSGSPFKNDMAPAYSLNVDPSGKFLYAVDNDPGGIAIFSIGTGGELTQISGSPVTSGGVSTTSPSWMAIK